MHCPQPIQSVSEMKQIVSVGLTSIQSFPVILTGHFLLHSCWHFLGLHLSGLMIAILILSSDLSTMILGFTLKGINDNLVSPNGSVTIARQLISNFNKGHLGFIQLSNEAFALCAKTVRPANTAIVCTADWFVSLIARQLD